MIMVMALFASSTTRVHVVVHKVRTFISRITWVGWTAFYLLTSNGQDLAFWYCGARAGAWTCFCWRHRTCTAFVAINLLVHIFLAKLKIRLPCYLFYNHIACGFPIRCFQLVLNHHFFDLQLLAHLTGIGDLLCGIKVFRPVAWKAETNAHRSRKRINYAVVVRASVVRKSQRLVAVVDLFRVEDVDRRQIVAVKLDWSIVHFRHCLYFYVISVQMILTLSVHVVRYV